MPVGRLEPCDLCGSRVEEAGLKYVYRDGCTVYKHTGPIPGFRCFWSTGTGWGTFAFGATGSPLRIQVLSGSLPCGILVMPGAGRLPPVSAVRLGDRALPHRVEHDGGMRSVSLSEAVMIAEDQELVVS